MGTPAGKVRTRPFNKAIGAGMALDQLAWSWLSAKWHRSIVGCDSKSKSLIHYNNGGILRQS